MAATGTPKQGDHVFNDVETAIMRPFEILRSLRSDFVDGQHFVPRYLLKTYSFARHLANNEGLAAARGFAASSGDEDQAMRGISRLRLRDPVFIRISLPLLREAHARNAAEFGRAAGRFHLALLTALQRSLEISVAPQGVPLHVAGTPSPGLAYQEMLNAAYDPASALILIAARASRENMSIESSFNAVLLGITETLDRPGMWKIPYDKFREDRASATGKLIHGIRSGLTQMEFLKTPGGALANLISQEVVQSSASPRAQSDFGAMLHLVQTNLQQRHEEQ